MQQGKLNMHIIRKCSGAADRKSKLVNAYRNYSLSNLARFFETQCRYPNPKSEFTRTFIIRSLWTFAVCSSFTGSTSIVSLLFSALFPNVNSRSVLHLASITDFELLTRLHRIFAMTFAMPLAGSDSPSSSCDEPAMSSLLPVSVNKYKMIANMTYGIPAKDCFFPLGFIDLNIWLFDFLSLLLLNEINIVNIYASAFARNMTCWPCKLSFRKSLPCLCGRPAQLQHAEGSEPRREQLVQGCCSSVTNGIEATLPWQNRCRRFSNSHLKEKQAANLYRFSRKEIEQTQQIIVQSP